MSVSLAAAPIVLVTAAVGLMRAESWLIPGSGGPPTFADIGAAELEALRVIAERLGSTAMEDAGWILPSLLGLLVGVYASDYGARRRLGSRPIDPSDGEDQRIIRQLALLSAFLGAFAIDYILLAIDAAVLRPTLLGHLVGVIGLGLVVLVLAFGVGMFDPISLTGLIKANRLAQQAAISADQSLGAGELRAAGLSTGGSILRIVIWCLAPLALIVTALGLGWLLPGAPTVWQALLFTGLATSWVSGLVGFSSWWWKVSPQLDNPIWIRAGLGSLGFAAAAGALIVPAAYVAGGGIPNLVVAGVQLAACAVVTLAWLLPARGHSGNRILNATPKTAVVWVTHRYLESQATRLERRRKQLKQDRKVLRAAKAGH